MKKRILSRMLAKELSAEELGLPAGGTVVVAAARTFEADAGGDETGPPVSTLVATLPDYSEDK